MIVKLWTKQLKIPFCIFFLGLGQSVWWGLFLVVDICGLGRLYVGQGYWFLSLHAVSSLLAALDTSCIPSFIPFNTSSTYL